MTPGAADVVVCGAGIAGVAAAYHLAARHGVGRVLLVDDRPPLSLTSDKSTEAYRNFWPGPDDAMVRFMNRSIDLLEALAESSGDVFRMNRRGYVFGTADPARAWELRAMADTVAGWGAGPLRVHDRRPGAAPYPPPSAGDWRREPAGIDLLLDRALIRKHFPYVAADTVAILHARRCGWLSGQQLGMHLLEGARRAGAELVEGRLAAVDLTGGQVTGVTIDGPGGRRTLATPRLVLAAGPLLPDAARLLGITLPVFSERHHKIAIEDTLGAVPRDAPFLIWDDAQTLDWSTEEREALAADPDLRWMLGPFPAGVHTRPEGASPESQTILVLWSYDSEPTPVVYPLPEPPHYQELVLRGMARMVPAFRGYLERLPRAYVDGGYYVKTRENRPLIGPLPVPGAYLTGAYSGFGIMASCAGGELLAAHVTGAALPDYAPAFTLARYDDPGYVRRIEAWGATTGQI
ncbi:MAG TPA: FAD-binding oxidoreductase [Methylomirabilota bacterium]|nr:FAD-binding oxidoreductase [Methylomirabilota bacterium]